MRIVGGRLIKCIDTNLTPFPELVEGLYFVLAVDEKKGPPFDKLREREFAMGQFQPRLNQCNHLTISKNDRIDSKVDQKCGGNLEAQIPPFLPIFVRS